MLARRFKGQLQLLALTFGFYFGAADSRLQFQEFQLVVGEFFAPGPVLLDPDQTQSFFQDPHLIFCELKSIPNKRQRAVELFKERWWKLFLKLANQLRVRDLDGSKTAAQTNEITNKNAVTFIGFSYSFRSGQRWFFDTSLCAVCSSDRFPLTRAKVLPDSNSLDRIGLRLLA